MIVLWILLYVIGFVATTIGMKYFAIGNHVRDGSWWAAVVLWPVMVPIMFLVLAGSEGIFAAIGWWDSISDAIVERMPRAGKYPAPKPPR